MLKEIIKKTTPHAIKVMRRKYKQHQLNRRIIKYLRNTSEFEELEKKNIIRNLKKNPLSFFPYDFTKRYNAKEVIVYTDDNNKMKYVIHENKRLYFKKDWDEKKIQIYYNSLLLEQDIDSPHRYETADFFVNDDDVVVDAGAAEGNFALSVVEKVKKLYLFESDEEWIEALKATFAQWNEKVEFIRKYVSDSDEGNRITLDTFLGTRAVNFIKADIEGAEIALLEGCRNILFNSEKLKVVMCTYHKKDDSENIKQILTNLKFNVEFSKGYMLYFLYDPPVPPYLRKGLIRAVK